MSSRLKILVENDSGGFEEAMEVHFNPNKVTLRKSSKWRDQAAAQRDVPAAQFTHGEPASLSLELLFDTYETRGDVKRGDVREHTGKLFHLTTVEKHGELHRPPLCRLVWGRYDFDGYAWVLQSLDQTFTLFLADGRPARAKVSCSFRQWRSDEMESKQLGRLSPDVAKRRTVRQGDTLSAIAAEMYRDPGRWRPIAEANAIDNPRHLEPGQVLAIPALRPGAAEAG